MSKRFQFSAVSARTTVDLIGTAAVTSAGVLVFLQLAAGPDAKGASASAPLARVARRDELRAP